MNTRASRTSRIEAVREPGPSRAHVGSSASVSRDECPACGAAVFENAAVKVVGATIAPLPDPGYSYRAACRRCKALLVRSGMGPWSVIEAAELDASRFIGPN